MDPRTAWNAVERLAPRDHELARDLAELLRGPMRDALAALARAEGCEGGTLVAEEAAETAILAAERQLHLEALEERGDVVRVSLTHSGEGCRHTLGYVRHGSARRAAELLRAGRIPRRWRAEHECALVACDEGSVGYDVGPDVRVYDGEIHEQVLW